MRDKKPKGDEDVPRDVSKLLREEGLRLMTQLFNNIYKNGEWPKDFTEVTIISLKNKPAATKCSIHCIISLIAHTAKIVPGYFEGLKRKVEDVLGEDQFGIRRGKGNRDAIGMLIINIRTNFGHR